MGIHISNEFSLIPILLNMVFGDSETQFAKGTGFLYEYKDMIYLITNGHNITGVNPESNERISPFHVGFPSDIMISLRIRRPHEESGYIIGMSRDKHKISLYDDEFHEKLLWFVHPVYGYKVDVVAIPFCEKDELFDELYMKPITSFSNLQFSCAVADDVFILGYPFGITDKVELPIWKKGSIATEPSSNYKGLPRLLIDTASRSGMSGSPIIMARSGGVHSLSGEVWGKDNFWGIAYGFVGVYSGRIGSAEEGEAQLGVVWRKEVIDEIIVGEVSGSVDFQRL